MVALLSLGGGAREFPSLLQRRAHDAHWVYWEDPLPEHFHHEEGCWLRPGRGQASEGEGFPPPALSPPCWASLFQDVSFALDVQLHLQHSF